MANKPKLDTPNLKDILKIKIVRVLFVLFSLLVFLLLVCVIVLAVYLVQDQVVYCDSGLPTKPRNFEKPSVFDNLTPKEYSAVKTFMFTKSNLTLTPLNKATPESAYIYMIDVYLPTKDKVLEHLDSGLEPPDRKAIVVIVRGDLHTRVVEEYVIGPLPNPSNLIKIKTIPYNFKPLDSTEYEPLYNILHETTKELYPLLMESYGAAYHNCTAGVTCLTFYDVAPRGVNDNERRTWFWAFRAVEGFYIHPLGLEIQIDHSKRTSADWKIVRIVYNGQMRTSVQLLMDDYKRGNIKKLKMPVPSNDEIIYSSYKRRGKSEMKIPLQGPKLVEPDGHRYTVDGFHVTYMHWDFNLHPKTSTGVQLFDVKFQGQRIAYELSLQEASVFYSGYGPAQGITNYYDVSWLMGSYINELVPGVDCPETSTFLDVDTLVNRESPSRIKKGICIFEDHAEHPLRRHFANDFDGGYFYYGGLGDYRLVVRSIANVWNYDYIFDYIFHLSGAVEVRVAATGYVQSAFPLAEELKYGSKITPHMMANIHQHLFNYKVDLDINGRSNVYSTLDISTETITPPWYKNFNKTQFKYEMNRKSTEEEANYQNRNEARYDIFFNDNSENKFNHKKAYRILNLGKTPFLLSESSETNAARWAKFPIAVSKFKDTERSSTSIYANNGPRNPVVDFESFISDNDTLINEDLVAWVTTGVLHIPHTEDVPSTTTTGSQVRFYLLPFNYFPECPSMSSPSSVRIVPKGQTGSKIDTFGTSHSSRCVQKEIGLATFDGRLQKINIDD